MHMLLVKFASALPHEDVLRLMDERLDRFRAVPGLAQKYYAREPSTGEYVGVYLFDSEESLRRYRESDLAASIAGTYQVVGTSRREVLELLFPLRPEAAVTGTAAG